MSIGLAILLSVLALIAVWQLDKHAAWGKLWRLSKWLFVIALVGSGTLAIRWYWTAAATERESKARARAVRAGELREYWGIKLGDEKNQVLYLKGEPSSRSEKDGESLWVYAFGDERREVNFSRRGVVDYIGCNVEWGCEPIAGVRIGTSEQAIREMLGAPVFELGPDARGVKSLYYGSEEYGVKFWLQRGETVVIGVGRMVED
jgi:hypothetical protein